MTNLVMDICYTAFDAVSQEQTEQHIYPRHPELDSGSIQDDLFYTPY